MSNRDHVSTLELDLYFVDRDGDWSKPIAAHVASCTACAVYLEMLASLERDGSSLRAPPPPAPLPLPRTAVRSAFATRRLIAPAAAVLALAAGLLLWVRARPASDDAYVGVKGVPALQVLVRDGVQTRVWDGRSAVHSGDANALHVACEQLKQVMVVANDERGLVRLWEGPCPRPPAALPFTLRVDDQPGRERFVVVLGKTRLDEAALRDALRMNTRQADLWVIGVELPKETGR